jgi:hypothetical protein
LGTPPTLSIEPIRALALSQTIVGGRALWLTR